MVKRKAAKKQLAPSIEGALDKLVSHYPNGFTRSFSKGRVKYIPSLTHDEIKLLLNKVSSNRDQFSQLITLDRDCVDLFKLRQDKLINNWFNSLLKADIQRKFEIKDKARRQEKATQDKAAYKKMLANIRSRRQDKALAAKTKNERKIDLWKSLNLSSEQKIILRKLAQ